jgi:hypothetical protein
MQGYASRTHGTDGIHDRLQATAIAFDDGKHSIAIVTCDLIGLDRTSTEKIREIVKRTCGVETTGIMINCSHTHGGPATGSRSYVTPPEESYLRTLEGKVASAICKAILDLQNASTYLGSGEVQIGANRRARSDGGMVIGVNPSGPIDREVLALRADSLDGHSFGLLFNHSCHGTTLGGENYMITSDYIGYARKTLESTLGDGFLSAYMNGAAGNINPHPRGTFEHAKMHGLTLGAEALKASQTAEPLESTTLSYASRSVEFPLSLPPPKNQLESDLDELLPEYERATKRGEHVPGIWAKIVWTREMLERIETDTVKTHLDAEIQAIRIGELGIVSLPGEVFVELGLHAKRHSPFDRTMIGGYTNGNMGYIPTSVAFDEGGYEPNSHVYLVEQQYDSGIEEVAKMGMLEALESCTKGR